MWRDNTIMTDTASLKVLTQRWLISQGLSVALCACVSHRRTGEREKEREREREREREMPRYWEPVQSVVRTRGHHNVESDTDTETQRPTLALTPPCAGALAPPGCVMLRSYRLLKYFTFQPRDYHRRFHSLQIHYTVIAGPGASVSQSFLVSH